MLRRLEKRIFIPLPDYETRAELFETYLNTKNIELYPKVDFKEFASKTEGYSGSDIKLVCKEALMSTVRKMLPNMVGKGEKKVLNSYSPSIFSFLRQTNNVFFLYWLIKMTLYDDCQHEYITPPLSAICIITRYTLAARH